MARKDARPAIPLPTRRPNHEVQVGVFVLLGLIAALVALFAGTNPDMLRGRYRLSTVVKDAGGIRKGDPVRLRGVDVGGVRAFRLVPGGVEITFNVDRSFTIPADSRVEIQPSGLLGQMAAEIIPGQSSERAASGQPLAGSAEGGAFAKVDQLAGQAGKTLGRVQDLLSDRTVSNVQTSSAELAALLGQLSGLVSEQRESLAALTQSLRRSARGVERVASGPELTSTLSRLNTLTSRLDQAAASLDRSSQSAEQILGRVAQGRGSLGRLSKEDALYENMNQAAASIHDAASQLGELAKDVRQNPKRYVKLSLF